MNNEFYIVSKSILPDCFEKVIKARDLLRSGAVKEVSEAAAICGISRSTYYKYKDHVFLPKEGDTGRRLVVSMILSHERGVLGRVLSMLSGEGANVVTINQNPPISGRASVVVSLDIDSLSLDIDSLLKKLAEVDGVENPTIIDMA